VYENGRVSYVDFVAKDEFGVDVIDDIVKEIRCNHIAKLSYRYVTPGSNLDTGLNYLATEEDVLDFMGYVCDEPCLTLYVEDKTVGEIEEAGWQNDCFINMTNELNDDSESDDDRFDDDANVVDEVEVDMKNFKLDLKADEGSVDDDIDGILDEDDMSNDSFGTSSSDDEDPNFRRRKRAIRKLRKQQEGCKEPCTFFVGQKFGNNDQIKKLVRRHAVETRRELKFYRNDQQRIRAICKGKIPHFDKGQSEVPSEGPSQIQGEGPSENLGEFQGEGPSQMVNLKAGKGQSMKLKSSQTVGPSQKDGGRNTLENPNKCPWVLYAIRVADEPTWIVSTYNPEHKCLQSRSVRAFTSDFLSKELLEQIQSNPGIPIKSIQEQMQKKYEMSVSRMKAFRAKTQASEQLMGDYTKQYSDLRDYALELQQRNPGTTVRIEVEPEPNPSSDVRVFKRIYVCLGPLKQGFKACKRDIIGLDGAFMKGPFPGQLLTAVGMDPNNGIFPVAYALVEAETTNSWCWFLEILGEDLDLQVNSNFTFISDRQKGIIPAITKLYPSAEHRYCLRHIHQNMKQKWRGKAFKDMLWNIATATTVQEFEQKMGELRSMNVEAYQWLNQIPAVHWARSHFTG
jgi:hypothetical protein